MEEIDTAILAGVHWQWKWRVGVCYPKLFKRPFISGLAFW